jgi:hypothetical protein
LKSRSIVLEIHEHYLKQTYRNRCRIAAANGLLDLIIPVEKVFGNHTPMKDIRIVQNQKWQRNHWRAILSAYSSSPFFMYYEPELKSFFNRNFSSLMHFNLEVTEAVLRLIGVQKELQTSHRYVENTGSEMLDLRKEFSPKKVAENKDPTYTQVFSDKWGFYPNLSILDLLFNLGPGAKSYLSE